jgi:N-methylhydantoinase A
MIDMLEADANNALRRVISGQGIHPSEFTLLSYGGSGPLHLAGCSRGIGFKDIITFQFADAFSDSPLLCHSCGSLSHDSDNFNRMRVF